MHSIPRLSDSEVVWRERLRRLFQRLFFLWISVLVIGRTEAAVVINEIHPNPDAKTEPVEFIELYNTSDSEVDLSGWSFDSGVDYLFPQGTSIPGKGYLAIGENPGALRAKFGVSALGPWTGRLSAEGENVVLKDASGRTVDSVDYQLGFPWPIVGDAPGYSMELINPNFDNDLGGNWRSSNPGGIGNPIQMLIREQSDWKYFKGISEASSPVSGWRQPGFDDTAWSAGIMPIGYGEAFVATSLRDMRDNYFSVFFRKSFVVANPEQIGGLILEAMYDDGINVWINGVHVLRQNAVSAETAYNTLAPTTREDASWVQYPLPSPAAYLIPGTNVIAVQGYNVQNSSDFFVDFKLSAVVGPASRGPTPGAQNSVFATNAPPRIRQVAHTPKEPASSQTVTITAKITDEEEAIAQVELLYQVVEPGNYIELTDAAYQTQWTALPMNDAGMDGDNTAGDTIFTAQLPPSLQAHRRLIRYRITARDSAGYSVTVPYADDPQPNFAYFVYDGVPSWSGAIQPGSTDPTRSTRVNFGTNVMQSLPVYHLLAKKASVEASAWKSNYGGDLYRWQGTLVYDGKVYDHIRYRARGGVWRYAMGKNMWKFNFNRGHRFEPRDNYGKKYSVAWDKLNLGACIQQGDYQHRGEQGMFESVGFRLFNLAGVESPKTHFVHFRVIDDVVEADPANQYEGDFWGLYLGLEQPDGRLLDEHGLPDGNLYKMDAGTGELNNQGPTAAADRSDLDRFISNYRGSSPSDAWWRTNLDLQRYYSYRTIVEGIHHYDIDDPPGKNYFYYLNPETGRWSMHSWDLDLTWADNMYGGGNEPFKNRVLGPTRAAFNIEYDNRIRELRDLLFNTDQTYQLIDEYASIIFNPASGPSFVDADRAMWDYNPILASGYVNPSKAGHGRFYQAAPTRNFAGMLQKMKNYVVNRGTLLDSLSDDPQIPGTPAVSYMGPERLSIGQLQFRASPYSGVNAFAAIQWRVGRITRTNDPAFNPKSPRHYEIEAVWESPEFDTYVDEVQVPAGKVEVGGTYRVRARVKDVTGRWSHWSDPFEFTATESDSVEALQRDLRIAELMYNPPAGTDFEYVELHNISGSTPLRLDGASFTDGIEFTFSSGTVIPPEGYLVLVKANPSDNFAAFRAHYQLDSDVLIAGPFSGSLNNGGETVELSSAPGGTQIIRFTYENKGGWPATPDGEGDSLHWTLNNASGSDPMSWTAGRPTPGGPAPDSSSDRDSDGDGVPDEWEIAHALNPNDATDALLDADGDGMNNRDEYRSGTDPRAASSVLRPELLQSEGGGKVALRFTAMAGKPYVIQFCDELSGSEWLKLQDVPVSEAQRLVVIEDIPLVASGSRFFRIVIPAVP